MNIIRKLKNFIFIKRFNKLFPDFKMIEPTPMTLETEFPCIVMFKNDEYRRDLFQKYMNDMVLVVGYHSNQEPESHLNCRPSKYPFRGRHYSAFNVVGVSDKIKRLQNEDTL